MNRLIGISTLYLQSEYSDKRAIEIAKEIGADAIDFFLGNEPRTENSLYNKSDSEIIEYYSNLKAVADSLGIVISQTHGRASRFDAVTVEKCRLYCIATAALGAKVMVVHPITLDSVPQDSDHEYIRNLNLNLFMSILPFAKECGIKIAMETLANTGSQIDFFGNTDEFFHACERIEQSEYGDCFTVCLDTGHSHKAVRYGFEPVDEVILRLGSRITVLHLNDNNGIKDQHKMVFDGSIEWNKVFDSLDEIGYCGVYNMEIALGRYGRELMVDYAAFAVKVLREFINKRYA